jgi:hypothetical protein
MLREGADPDDVQMTDVLCDFCHVPWTEDVPFIEGHRGAVICGGCLRAAYADMVLHGRGSAPPDFTCTMCREGDADRAAIGREGEAGWSGPAGTGTCVCRRCVKQASGVLHKDRDVAWSKPC